MANNTFESIIAFKEWFMCIISRLIWLSIIILMLIWLEKYQGGFSLTPIVLPNSGPNENDTSRLFNWHPLLMALGFVLFMTEAILTYSSYPLNLIEPLWKKIVHTFFHLCAAACIILGTIAVFRSHNEKLPNPYDNLYSLHSYLGITTFVFVGLQIIVGALVYFPTNIKDEAKKIYSDIHYFFGSAAYICGLITILTGMQELIGFKGGCKNVGDCYYVYIPTKYCAFMTIPASMGVLIILLGTAVIFHSFIGKKDKIRSHVVSESAAAQESLIQDS